MGSNSIPHFGQLLPMGTVAGHLPARIAIEGLVWQPKDATAGDIPWQAHEIDPSLVALQRLAGTAEGDTGDTVKLTLHFVLCKELEGLALKTATVGGVRRESRYEKYLAQPFDEAELVRLGLRSPTLLPPLEARAQGATRGSASASPDGETAAAPSGDADATAVSQKDAKKDAGGAQGGPTG